MQNFVYNCEQLFKEETTLATKQNKSVFYS